MSDDSFTEVTEESWFSRIGNAIKGILIGLVFFAGSFFLLFWNEGRSVQTYKTLKEGGKSVISMSSDRVDPANAGKLVHMTGKAVTTATLSDPDFGVSVQALKLGRVAEMYQWEEKKESETQKKVGGGSETITKYTYNKTWSASPISSAGFKKPEGHQNPNSMRYSSVEYVAEPITVGAFKLSPSLAGQLRPFTPLAIKADQPLPAGVKGKLENNGIYIGKNSASPEIGDLRVSFRVVNPGDVSIVAQQVGDTFEPFVAKAGGTIELLQPGVFSAASMIKTAEKSNAMLTWILRGVGFLLMFMGLALMLKPLSVLADVLPILGDIVSAGTGIISFLLAAVLSVTIIAIAWIVYRPFLGIILIAAAVGVVVLIRGRLLNAKAKKVKAAPVTTG
jgi:hypothetical protein